MRHALLLFLLLPFASAACMTSADATLVEDIDRLPPVVAQTADAIGNARSGCTFTYLGNGFAISAARCVGTNTNDACEALSIFWGDRAGAGPYLVSRCTKVIARDAMWDTVLIRVDPKPRAKVRLEWDAPAAENRAVAMLSHPEGRPLTWSPDCRIASTAEAPLHHNCNVAGNRGSMLLDPATGKAIALLSDARGTSSSVRNFAAQRAAIEAPERAPAVIGRGAKVIDAFGRSWQLRELATPYLSPEQAAGDCRSTGAQLPGREELSMLLEFLPSLPESNLFRRQVALVSPLWIDVGGHPESTWGPVTKKNASLGIAGRPALLCVRPPA